jgi:7-cyano-7-deazaguanine synthase
MAAATDRDRAVVLVSGGMDSCVAAAIAVQAHHIAFLHFQYGQRTGARELRAFHAIADHYAVRERLVTRLDHFSHIGGSALTDRSSDIPAGDLSRQGIPDTYVPFRNANLLAAAVSWAEVLGARRVFIGAVEEDSSGYPDCRREFYDAFNRVVALGTRPEAGIRVDTPLIGMSKAEIVSVGIRLQAPLHLTWSCYRSADVACGRCDSCLLRLRAFREAGVEDPVDYAAAGPVEG